MEELPQSSRILISGGSGLIGSRLKEWLQLNGFEVRVLSSRKSYVESYDHAFYWNVAEKEADEAAFAGVNAVFNFSGESIAAGLWSHKRKKRMLSSRVEGTALLLEKLYKAGARLVLYFGTSAVGYYGTASRGDLMKEEDHHGDDFLADVCVKWEEEHRKFSSISDRLVIGRLGNVLSPDGGFLLPFRLMSKTGMRVYFSKSAHPVPWIHIDDLVNFLTNCLKGNINGVYNLVAGSENWFQLQRGIYDRIGPGRAGLTIPAWLLKMSMGEMSSLMLGGCAVSGEKLLASGLELKYRSPGDALKAISAEIRKKGK